MSVATSVDRPTILTEIKDKEAQITTLEHELAILAAESPKNKAEEKIALVKNTFKTAFDSITTALRETSLSARSASALTSKGSNEIDDSSSLTTLKSPQGIAFAAAPGSDYGAIRSRPNTERDTWKGRKKKISEINEQIAICKRFILEKENALNPIYRIPTEIWCIIFLECAISEPDTASTERPFPPYPHPNPNLVGLTLSAVSRAWRTIAMGYGQLWANITIVWETWIPYNFERIKHYYTLSSGCRQTFLVNGFSSPDIGMEEVHRLGQLFTPNAPVDHIVCFLSCAQDTKAQSIFTSLPPARELWIFRHHSFDNTSFITIPPNHCRAAKALALCESRVQWSVPTEVHLEKYLARVSAILRYPHESIPGSLSTLHTAYMDAEQFRLPSPTCPDRHTLGELDIFGTNISFLANYFIRWYQLPKLRCLEIVSPSLVTQEAWNLAQSYLDFAQIKEITCSSMKKSLEPLADHLLAFQSVTHIELQGESVIPIMTHWTSKIEAGHSVFPSLSHLAISNESASAPHVLMFLVARQAMQHRDTTSVISIPEVVFKGCGDIPLHLRKEIQSFVIETLK